MGTIVKGILGGFSGTIGTVIGGSWKGIDYMRSQPSKKSFNPTQNQLEQQAKFRLVIKFLGSMGGLVALGFGNIANQMTGQNSAMSYILKSAVTGVYPNYTILYPQVLISRGELPAALNPIAVAAAGGLINFSWTNNAGVGKAKATDLALLVVYCEDYNQCIYTTGSAARSAGTDSLNVSFFSGKTVQTYIGFISADGYDIASSIFTGQHTVL